MNHTGLIVYNYIDYRIRKTPEAIFGRRRASVGTTPLLINT